jgi:NAD(P)-dependent dehydrogenase (short-subunit alcohol dehydrogenase family)
VYLPEEQSDAEETRDAVSGEGTRCLLIRAMYVIQSSASARCSASSMARAAIPRLKRGSTIVNAGPIWTPLNVADKKATDAAKHGKETPMERPGQPEEVAPAYAFFASNSDSSYITGEILTLLGAKRRRRD